MKSNKKNQIQLPAYLNCGNEQIKGKLSISDGFFLMPTSEEFHFYRNGNIEFNYQGKDYSFDIENLGGKYFIKERRDKNYLSLASMIVLNEILETSDEKNLIPKIKI